MKKQKKLDAIEARLAHNKQHANDRYNWAKEVDPEAVKKFNAAVNRRLEEARR